MATINRYLRRLALGIAACVLTVSTSLSDDIDVYVDPPSSATIGETLVVFTLDVRPDVLASTVCSAGSVCEALDALFAEAGMLVDEDDDGSHDNKISRFEMLVAALKKVLFAIDNNKVKVALMIPHDDTTGGNKQCVGYVGKSTTPECSNGAYVLSGFKRTGNIDELNQFFAKLESLPLKDGANWSHDYQLKELFFEMFRYVSGGDVYNNENGLDNFGTGNENELNISHVDDTVSVNPAVAEPEAELMWDTDAVEPNDKRYINTLDIAEHCTDIFSVNVTAAKAAKDHDSDADIAASFPAGFGFDPDDNEKGRVQVLEYLRGTDLADHLVGKQNIRSYFVTTAGRTSTANAWAEAGGTGSALVVEDDPVELVRLLSGLFNEIKGVSTTFIAASVPANVFNRAETLDEVFIAIFEPDEGSHPFWVGNVKKLTRKTVDKTVEIITNEDGSEEVITEETSILVDVLEADKDNPTSAINPLDGRIRADALTYWTRTGTGDEYLPPPPEDSDEDLEYSEGTDGRRVDRGGAGQVKPGYLPGGQPGDENPTDDTTLTGPRKIFTEADDDTVTGGLLNLNADSSDATAIELLEDPRTYPGSTLTYGAYLYQTVMEGCLDCETSYVTEDDATHKATAEDRVTNLIRYARGYDFTDIDTATGEKRAWWQADPLHSRPLALNYGAHDGHTEDRPDIRIVIGSNDGMIQMIRDGRELSDTGDDVEDGVEAWGFLPREFVPLQKRLLDGLNDVGQYIPGQPINDDEEPRTPLHPYAMDGAPTALVIDNNRDGTINPDPPTEANPDDGNDQVYLFFGQRRGGKRYYALDVTDPDNPEFLWSIGQNDSSDFSEMGQSWSVIRPAIMRVQEGDEIKRRPVAIFSGGYNGDDGGDGVELGKDTRVAPGADGIYGPNPEDGVNDDVRIVGTADDEGNALFIVNALTGDLIWKVVGPPNGPSMNKTYDSVTQTLKNDDLVDSVAAAPSLVDGNGDGFVDRVYFADTGGNVWRMDAAAPDRSEWTVGKLFEGGRHFQNDIANDRRFFHAPDIVFADDENGRFDAVILTSGDRPHPLGTEVENWIYMIKDRHTTSGTFPDPDDPDNSLPLTHDDLADLTNNCLQDQTEDNIDFSNCGSDATEVEANLPNGWKAQLIQCDAGGTDPKCGEKGLASPLTIEGTIFFTTYLPVVASSTDSTPTTCSPAEGSGLLYGLDLQTAGGVLDFNPDNNVGGAETPDRFDKLASPGVPPNPVPIGGDKILRPDLKIQKVPARPNVKTFWYERRFD